MRYTRFLFISLALTLSGLYGCQSRTLSPPYTAEVLTMIPKDDMVSPEAPPVYKIQPATFQNLDDLDTLTHRYFNTFFGGILSYRPLSKDTFGLFSVGESIPKLHYLVKNGVVVPQNEDTLLALSTAYQFDFILSQLQEFSGVDPREVFALGQKFTFFHHTRYWGNGQLFMNNNAFYLFGSIATLRPTNTVNISESGNLDALTHEFGHLIFNEYLLPKTLTGEILGKANVANALMGLNEGFADFFAFSLTGNSNNLSGGRDVDSFTRVRNFADVEFDLNTMDAKCPHQHYCIGILFNNALFKSQIEAGPSPYASKTRHDGFKAMVRAIKASEDEIVAGLKAADNRNTAIKAILAPVLNNIKEPELKSALQNRLTVNFPGVF